MLFKRRKCLCNMNLLVYFIFLMSFFKKTFGFERKCAFAVSSQSNPNSQFNVTYNDETFECVQCANGNTNLLNKRQNWYQEGVCRSESCNGVVCTSKCIPISQFSSPKNPIAVLSVCRSGRELPSRPSDTPPTSSSNHVPLIIGFAVGGIMLAVVIAGVFLGRANQTANQIESGDVTTPVSMSYSEWISNYSTGGRGSKVSNMRVQETGDIPDDQQGLAVYSIVYEEDDVNSGDALRTNMEDATVIEVDGMVPYEEPNQYAVYQPPDDVMDYTNAPIYNGDEAVTFEWTDEYLPYEYLAQHEIKSIASSQDTNHNYVMTDVMYPDDVTGQANQSMDDASVYSRGRNSCWSDESCYNETSLRTPLDCHSVSDASKQSCLHDSRDLALVDTSNTAHLKHVFVDVHRSMTCSCEDLRESQLVLGSSSENPSVLFRQHGVTKQKSFLAFKKHYTQTDRNQTSDKIYQNVQFLPLPPSRVVFNRRYSV